jgi:hypothetical protein
LYEVYPLYQEADMQKTSGGPRKIWLGILIPAAVFGIFAAGANAQSNPSAIGTPIDPALLSPLKPVPPSAPAMLAPPAYSPHEAASQRQCGAPYPCRLQSIIDRPDWPAVLEALTSAMPPPDRAPRREWSSGVNNHKGYVQQETEPYRPVCKTFEVVSYMGTTTGKEKVTVCRQTSGEITVR